MAKLLCVGLPRIVTSLSPSTVHATTIDGDRTCSRRQVPRMRPELGKRQCSETSQQAQFMVPIAVARIAAMNEVQPLAKVWQPALRAASGINQEFVTRILTEASDDDRLTAGAGMRLVRKRVSGNA